MAVLATAHVAAKATAHCATYSSLLCACMLLTACQTMPSAPAQNPVPARMQASKTTTACIAQMQNAAAPANGSKVVLTNAAFANDDRLSIAPTDPLDAAGLPRSGRLRGVPDSYRLSLQSGRCMMTRERDNQTTALDACTCLAML